MRLNLTSLGLGCRLLIVLGLFGLAACASPSGSEATDGRPQVVVSNSILGDVVTNILGDAATVTVLMPRGTDPHQFSPSTRLAEAASEADLLVINGGGLEGTFAAIIDTASENGTSIFTFIDHADPQQIDGVVDPHFWTDPSRMVAAVSAFSETAASLPGIDQQLVASNTTTYLQKLEHLDDEISEILSPVPEERRVLVTNHEVFGYFAQRYGFTILGAIVPSLNTSAEASAAQLDDLADTLRQQQIPAIFVETTANVAVAEALANSVGHPVDLVDLYTESLGDADSEGATYIDMMRTDAQRIAAALS